MIIIGGQAGGHSVLFYVVEGGLLKAKYLHTSKTDSSTFYENEELTRLFTGTVYEADAWEDITQNIGVSDYPGYIINSQTTRGKTGSTIESGTISVHWMSPVTCYRQQTFVNGIQERSTGKGFLYDQINNSFVKINPKKVDTSRYADSPLLTGKIQENVSLANQRSLLTFAADPEGSWRYYEGTWYENGGILGNFLLDNPDQYYQTVYTKDYTLSGTII